MPKLPVVSGKECRKAIGRLGFEEVRQRGSHLVMKRDDAGCVVPMHAEALLGGKITSGQTIRLVEANGRIQIHHVFSS